MKNLPQEDLDWIEQQVAKKPHLDAHSKGVYRQMLKREHEYWLRESIREDNNRYHDDI